MTTHDFLHEMRIRPDTPDEIVLQVSVHTADKSFRIGSKGPARVDRELAIVRYTLGLLLPKGIGVESAFEVANIMLSAMLDTTLPHNARNGLKLVRGIEAVDINNDESLANVNSRGASKETPEALEGALNADARRNAALGDVPDDMPVNEGNKTFATLGFLNALPSKKELPPVDMCPFHPSATMEDCAPCSERAQRLADAGYKEGPRCGSCGNTLGTSFAEGGCQNCGKR